MKIFKYVNIFYDDMLIMKITKRNIFCDFKITVKVINFSGITSWQ
jgi:hypothetical protein